MPCEVWGEDAIIRELSCPRPQTLPNILGPTMALRAAGPTASLCMDTGRTECGRTHGHGQSQDASLHGSWKMEILCKQALHCYLCCFLSSVCSLSWKEGLIWEYREVSLLPQTVATITPAPHRGHRRLSRSSVPLCSS